MIGIPSNNPPTAEQTKVIDSPLDESSVVFGPAGTGKTFTAIKRVQSILDNDDSNEIIIFTAYNHPTLAYAKRSLESLGLDAYIADINFSGMSNSAGNVIGLLSELKKAIESKRKKIILFVTNTVLSNFIGSAPRPGQDIPLIELKKQEVADASYKLHLFIDEAQVVSKVFLEELFDAFLPNPQSNDSSLFQDFKINLFLDHLQLFEGDDLWQNVGRHFIPRLTGSACDQLFENRQPKYKRRKLVENVRNPEPINKLNNRYLTRHNQDDISSLSMFPVPSDKPALFIRDDSKIQSVQDDLDQVVTMVANQCNTSPDETFGVILVSEKQVFDTPSSILKKTIAEKLNAAFKASGTAERAASYNFGDNDGWGMRTNPDFDTNRVWVMDTLSIRGVEFEHVIIPDLEIDAEDRSIEKRMYMAQSRTRGNLYVHTKKSTVDMFSSDDPTAGEAMIYKDLYEVIEI
jgi:hypothetical protein